MNNFMLTYVCIYLCIYYLHGFQKNNYVREIIPQTNIDSRPNTAGGDMNNYDEVKVEDVSAEDQKKQELDSLKKEEDDFLKMEAAFITELGLRTDEIPLFARSLATAPPTSPKK